MLLYVLRNHRLVRDGSPGRPPRLSHSTRALNFRFPVAHRIDIYISCQPISILRLDKSSRMAPPLRLNATCRLIIQYPTIQMIRVPGEIKISRDLRGGRWSWTLKFAQKRSWVGRWSWAEQVGRLLLRVVQVVRQQRCNGHCLSDCPAQRLKQQLHSAQVAGQWRGDTALTLPLFWRRSTVSPVFFGRFPRSSLSLSRPLPTLSPSLIGHLASVDVKQHESIQLIAVLAIRYQS